MIYIEPFGGSLGLFKLISKKYNPKKVVYNDLKDYKDTSISDYTNIIHHFDYSKIIEMYNTEDSFFYMDPPYIGKEHYYETTFNSIDDHYNLFEGIKTIKGKWMLSYHDHPLIREWYKNYKFDSYTGSSIYHKKEIIIKNY